MPKFFIDAVAGDTARLTGADARHAALSLRVRVGEAVTLCDCAGSDYNCVVDEVSPDVVSLSVLSVNPSVGEPPNPVVLYQCLPKGDKMDDIVRKSVELGATGIVPVLSDRCVSRPDEASLKKKIERWRQIAREAAMQSGRGRIPEVGGCLTYRLAVLEMSQGPCPALLYEGERELTLRDIEPAAGCSLLVGPEGGIAPDEARLAMSLGIPAVSLGRRILRTETAGPASIAIVNFITGG